MNTHSVFLGEYVALVADRDHSKRALERVRYLLARGDAAMALRVAAAALDKGRGL